MLDIVKNGNDVGGKEVDEEVLYRFKEYKLLIKMDVVNICVYDVWLIES